MDLRTLITTLRNPVEQGFETAVDCLSPADLAAYVDGEPGPERRAAAEAHLAECGRCLAALVAVGTATAASGSEAAPADLVEQAGRLYAPMRPGRRHLHAWAAAAAVLLTVGLLAQTLLPETGPAATGNLPQQTRGIGGAGSQLQLLAPAAGSVIRPTQQVFRWTEVPGSLFYDVRLLNPDGDLLLRERVEATRWLLPDTLQLEPGEEYFIRIDAYLSDAKYVSSEHVVIRVDGAQ